MITYRDMTFCINQECIKKDKCPRALTPLIEEQAKKLGLCLAVSNIVCLTKAEDGVWKVEEE